MLLNDDFFKERHEAALKAAGEKRKPAAETKKELPTKEELEMKERVEEYNVSILHGGERVSKELQLVLWILISATLV